MNTLKESVGNALGQLAIFETKEHKKGIKRDIDKILDGTFCFDDDFDLSRFIARVVLQFTPKVAIKKIKKKEELVALSVSQKGEYGIPFVYSSGSELVATCGSTLTVAVLTEEERFKFPAGYYCPKTFVPVESTGRFPDFRQVLDFKAVRVTVLEIKIHRVMVDYIIIEVIFETEDGSKISGYFNQDYFNRYFINADSVVIPSESFAYNIVSVVKFIHRGFNAESVITAFRI
jgi:hypothetical protein